MSLDELPNTFPAYPFNFLFRCNWTCLDLFENCRVGTSLSLSQEWYGDLTSNGTRNVCILACWLLRFAEDPPQPSWNPTSASRFHCCKSCSKCQQWETWTSCRTISQNSGQQELKYLISGVRQYQNKYEWKNSWQENGKFSRTFQQVQSGPRYLKNHDGKVKILMCLVDGQHLCLLEITPTTAVSRVALYKAGGTGSEEPVHIVLSGKRTKWLQTSTSILRPRTASVYRLHSPAD